MITCCLLGLPTIIPVLNIGLYNLISECKKSSIYSPLPPIAWLEGNPIVCDELLCWLFEYFPAEFKISANPCAYPPHLQSVHINELNPAMLHCRKYLSIVTEQEAMITVLI